MRVEAFAIEPIAAEAALLFSPHTSYIEQAGLQGKVTATSLKDNTGTRRLNENGWRGIDLHEVLKALQVSQNKLLILRLLRRAEWIKLLYMLDKKKLVEGLRFFSKEKLMRLMTLLPKSVLIKLLLQVYPLEQLIQKMPPRELFAILRSDKLDVRELVKGFQWMDPKYLAFILTKITGQHVGHLTQAEMLAMLMQLKKRQILDGMEMLPFKALMPFVLFHVKNDISLLENLSGAFLFKLFDRMSKPTMIDSMQILPESLLIRFLTQLPDKFLVLVAAQVDDGLFEKFLLSDHPGLLALLGGAEAA